MYKCLKCGHIFENGEEARWKESRGECWGTLCSEEMSGCPNCHGDYEETTPCAVCGLEHLVKELRGGVCNDCIEEYRYDVDMCFKIGANDTDSIELNCFLAAMFDKEEIEQILLGRLKIIQKYVKIDCRKFIDSEQYWFGENLVEEVKKNENAKG